MKTKDVLLVMALAIVGAAALIAVEHLPVAQAAGTFENKEAVVAAIHNNPQKVADLMEANLSQAQLSGFEALMVPPPTNAQELAHMQAGRAYLVNNGFLPEHPVVVAIDARIAELQQE